MTRPVMVFAVVLALAASVSVTAPAPASANVASKICHALGVFSSILGRGCDVATHPGAIAGAGKKLLGGHVGGAVGELLGDGGGTVAKKVAATATFAAITAWAAHGAAGALKEAATVIGRTTEPQLSSTWFSSTYWRVAGLAALLTLPFLFAAAVQALVRSEPLLLARAAFGYLPAALLLVSITAPLTMLLLAASDEMSSVVSAAAGHGAGRFLTQFGAVTTGVSLLSTGGSTFLALFAAVVIVTAGMALSLELLLREAAVYVIVLMLPLAFAAMVWPARRVWAVRAVELLVALILSKFVIVAVLALASGALGELGGDGVGTVFAGEALLLLATFSPWVLMRLLPLAEVAAGAGGALRGEYARARAGAEQAAGLALSAHGWAGDLTSNMRHDAADPYAEARASGGDTGPDAPRALGSGDSSGDGGDGGGGGEPSGPADGGGAAASDPAGGSPDPSGEPRAPAWGPSNTLDEGGERSPGMEPRWQAGDTEWPPLTLGPSDEPTHDLWPAPEDPRPADHRPAEQPPEDGAL
ncbi:MAG TPA: hypothetical protein VG223_00025 [Solirubrobacteraceae bacterium]|nr:hypothetical protein [Solirubrobacteraceae bacterium]